MAQSDYRALMKVLAEEAIADHMANIHGTYYLRGKAQGTITLDEARRRWHTATLVKERVPEIPEPYVDGYFLSRRRAAASRRAYERRVRQEPV